MPDRATPRRDRRGFTANERQRRNRWWRSGGATAAAALLAIAIVAAVIVLPRLGGGDPDKSVALDPLPAGPAQAAGVVVAEPVAELGHLPLDVTILHEFRVTNVGSSVAQLGRPSVVVLDGC